MIERLSGVFLKALPNGIILDVNGVGYGMDMPLSTLCELPPEGSPLVVWTYTYVREDALRLFGFLTHEDRGAFEVLLSVSGVGPKVALAMLSTLSVKAICSALQRDDASVFEVVPGIGKRLAEKILVDLKPKLRRLTNSVNARVTGATRIDADPNDLHRDENHLFEAVFDDLRSALENLGFKDKDVAPLLVRLKGAAPEANFQDLMRLALRELGGYGAANKASGRPEDDLF